MAIQSSEINLYQSQVVNFTNSNGGKISTTVIQPGLSNTWWPVVSEAQLISGAVQWRKSFVRIDNAQNTPGTNLRVSLWKPTAAEDVIYLASGTQTDIQSDITTPDLFGAGTLNSNITASVTVTFDVVVEDGTVITFRDGDLIRISSESAIGVGNAEYATISGTPSIVGDVVTITISGPLQNSYSPTTTFVSSVIETASVIGTTTNKVVTSVNGTFNEANMVVGSLGSIYQTLTFTFSSSSAYTVTSDALTFSSPNGTIGNIFAPTNVSVGASYVSVPPNCWGGTFADGDTVVITTVPPSVPIWEKRIIFAGTSAIALQGRTLVITVES